MKPQIIVIIEGGNVKEVIADQNINLYIVDYDTDGIPPEELKTLEIEGEKDEAYIYEGEVLTVDQSACRNIISQINNNNLLNSRA